MQFVSNTSRRFIYRLLSTAALVILSAGASASQGQSFQSPAPGYFPQFRLNGAPGAAFYKNQLYIGYGANDSSNSLYITHSADGVNFSAATNYPSVLVGTSPALVTYQGLLYVFYRNASNGTLYSMYSSDGINFTTPLQIQITSGGSVSTATTVSATTINGGIIEVAYTDSYGEVLIVQNLGGPTVSQPRVVAPSGTTSLAPSVAYFNGNVIVAYQQLANHNLVVSSSSDAVNWPTGTAYPNILIGSSPSVAAYSSTELLVAFKSDDKYNVFFAFGGSSASTITPSASGYYKNILIGSAPFLVATPGLQYPIYATFKSNDKYNILYTTGSN